MITQQEQSMSDFSFDDWAMLYKLDPEEFERKRTATIEAEICKAPIAQRNGLRLLQIEVNALREGKTPLGATAAITGLMLNKNAQLHDAFSKLQEEVKKLE